MDALVAFTCAAPAHRDTDAGPDKLTVHDGKCGIKLSLQHPAAIRTRSEGKDPSETR